MVTVLAEKCSFWSFHPSIYHHSIFPFEMPPCLVTRQIRFPHVSISGFETSEKMEGSYLVPGAVAPGILNSAGFGGFVPSWDHWDFGGWKLPWKKTQCESAHSPEIERIDTQKWPYFKGSPPFSKPSFWVSMLILRGASVFPRC